MPDLDSNTILTLVLDKITSVDHKLDAMKERLHATDRRSDEQERDIAMLKLADTKTIADLKALEASVENTFTEIKPIVETIKPLKKILYGGVAFAILSSIAPQFVGKLLK